MCLFYLFLRSKFSLRLVRLPWQIDHSLDLVSFLFDIVGFFISHGELSIFVVIILSCFLRIRLERYLAEGNDLTIYDEFILTFSFRTSKVAQIREFPCSNMP